MAKILWFVSTIEDVNFLKEFSKYSNINIDVFHTNYITRLALIGFNSEHLMPKYREKKYDIDVERTFNVLSGRLTVPEAQFAYSATYDNVNEYILSNIGEELVFIIPSGRHVHHLAAKELLKKYSLKSIYINYSNFPGYTFFDPKGTDSQSAIYSNIEILDRYITESLHVEKVFDYFSNLKKGQKSIPQKESKNILIKLKEYSFYIDSYIQKVFHVYGDRRTSFNNYQCKTPSSGSLSYRDANFEEEYVFFPLQVSTDQQVLNNYNKGSIYEAITEAIEKAKFMSIPLYIKEHPAEKNKEAIRSYLKKTCKENKDVYVVNENTSKLINNASCVITINSTVGLESKLMNKEVIFLGESLYKEASNIQLAAYLDRYFVDVDYHRPHLSKNLVDKILTYKDIT